MSYRRCPNDGSPLRTPDGKLVGWIGEVVQKRYRIARFLGKGGMAQVYEAEHLATGRLVALKIVEPRLASDPAVLDRFRREAQVLSLIAHPNVVAVEDFGTMPDGALFMVMELLRGRSLQQILDERSLAPMEALDIAEQVCEAVQAAHERGVAHRDIKPGNIFLEKPRSSGKLLVKVLDFGISKLVDEETSANVTKAGTVFGTPEYMSPQQARGQPADFSSDIYSIGVLLYRMLLGVVPFTGESYMAVLIQHITELAPWPEERAAKLKLPVATRDVVMKALEKIPEQRYPSASAFEQAILSLRSHWSTSYSLVSENVDSVRIPESARPSVSGKFRTGSLQTAKGYDLEIVTLAPDVYWVGRRTGGALECNTYLRVYRSGDKRVSVLIDPGPPRDLHIIGAKIASVIESITEIDMAFINHQDPDVSSNTAAFQKANRRLHVVCSEDTWRLVQLTGLDARHFSAVEHFREGRMRMTTGHEVTFVPSPYCHFRGAVMYYDRASRVLFTGDLFGGLTRSTHLLSRGRNWEGIDTFHQIYMPSNKAVRRTIERIRKLEPSPRILAPQHGAVIPEDQIEDLFAHLEDLPMGMDIDTDAADCGLFRRALNQMILALVDLLGADAVRARLKRFEGDGTFPDLISFENDLTIRDIKIDPKPAAGAVVRELTVAVPAAHMDAWLRAIHEAQTQHGVSVPGVPE
jgi:eukaryotic-like serine/threonine-protein kinase